MMSHQQNPAAVSRSLLQQTDSEKTNIVADFKPFSIREYAVACRKRNMIESWPFPEKYLHMCLNRGIRDVLPPFGPRGDDNSIKEVVDEPCKTEKEDINNCSVSVNGNVAADHDQSCSIHVDKSTRTTTPTTLAVKSEKHRRRRSRRNKWKKRSMVDILAVARKCTPQEIISFNKFFYNTTVSNIEGCHQKMEPDFENVSKSYKLKGDDTEEGYLCRKKSGIEKRDEDHQVANIGITGKGSLFVQFKLDGCNVINHNCRT